MRLMEESTMGPMCKFKDAHIYYALYEIYEKGTMSRGKLAELLGVGEGSVRKIVTLLRGWGLVEVRQTGVGLTQSGRDFLEDTPLRLVDVPAMEAEDGTFHQGVLIKGAAGLITNGVVQRDYAVIAGAAGAVVFVMRHSELTCLSILDEGDYGSDFADSVPGMADDDILVVTSASSPGVARISAIASGLSTI